MANTTGHRAHRTPLVNHVVLAVLATRRGHRLLPGLVALRFVGRTSGRVVTLPVAGTLAGTTVTVLVGRSAGKLWWRNFRHGHRIDVLVDGRWRPGNGEVITPDDPPYPELLTSYRTRHHVRADLRDPLVLIRLRADPA